MAIIYIDVNVVYKQTLFQKMIIIRLNVDYFYVHLKIQAKNYPQTVPRFIQIVSQCELVTDRR